MKIMSAVLAGAVILSQPAAVYAAADTQDYAEAVIEEDAGSFASEGGEDTGSSADHYEETPDEGTASFSQGDQNIYDGYDSSYVDAAAAQAAEVSGSGDLTDEEKAAKCRENPAYGKIVCRCETVTEGDLLDMLDAPIPAVTIDMMKKRLRAGMGRCQGGFCSPRVAVLIAERTGRGLDEINKSGPGSWLVTKREEG